MKRFICWSGGKDSTATIILAHLMGIKIDGILYAQVMFDEDTPGENPEHISFIMDVAIPTFRSWGHEVYILRSENTYISNFYSVVDKPRSVMENCGKYRGFPCIGACAIQRDCKLKPVREYLKSLGTDDYITCLGICKDEEKRLLSMRKDIHKVSLLEEMGYTKEMTAPLCSGYDLLSPTYSLKQKRGGCWFCPWAKEEELRAAKKAYPEAFERFISLEDETSVCGSKWNPFKPSLREINNIL